MKKKILITALVLTALSAYSGVFALDNEKTGAVEKTITQQTQNMIHPEGGFKTHPQKDGFNHHHGDFHKFHPSKAEMEKKKAEFEKRLKLTDEQKQQIQENRKQGHEKVKPIFEQKQEKLKEIKKIYKDTTLTKEEKQEKTAPLKADVKKLNEQANAYREENMKAFEAILTDKQKKEFNKIKQEQKKDMEKRKAEFSKKMEQAKKEGKKPIGFPPPPPKDDEIQY